MLVSLITLQYYFQLPSDFIASKDYYFKRAEHIFANTNKIAFVDLL